MNDEPSWISELLVLSRFSSLWSVTCIACKQVFWDGYLNSVLRKDLEHGSMAIHFKYRLFPTLLNSIYMYLHNILSPLFWRFPFLTSIFVDIFLLRLTHQFEHRWAVQTYIKMRINILLSEQTSADWAWASSLYLFLLFWFFNCMSFSFSQWSVTYWIKLWRREELGCQLLISGSYFI